MKTIRTAVYTLAALTLVLSCSKDWQGADNGVRRSGDDLLVSIEKMGTKTILYEGTKTKWADGDKIILYSVDRTATPPAIASATYAFDSSKGSSTFTKEGTTGDFDFNEFEAAFYPAEKAVSYDTVAHAVRASIDNLQTYADTSFAAGSAPMCSNQLSTSGDDKTLSFKNAFGVVKFNLVGNEKVSQIRISTPSLSTETAIAGTFDFALSGTNDIAVSKSSDNDAKYEVVLDCSAMTSALSSTATPFYIPVPGQPDGTRLSVMIVSGSGVIKNFTTVLGGSGNALVQNNIVNLPEVNTIQGVIPGLFSISATKQVYFSQGNLWCNTSSTYLWNFESAQWEYATAWNASHSGFFYWTTNNYGASQTYTSSSDSSIDWGTIVEPQLGAGWRTLSSTEWNYLLNTRPGHSDKVGLGTVHSVPGLILLPDNFVEPYPGCFSSLSIATGWTANVYSDANWALMEASGALFLPKNGFRDGTSLSSTENGYYWCSDQYASDQAWLLYFDSTGTDISGSGNMKQHGRFVRLVYDGKKFANANDYQSGDPVEIQ